MAQQISIDRRCAALWIATIDNPPVNLIDLNTITELQGLVTDLEADTAVKVIVFRSADPDFFLAHWDVLEDKRKTAAMPAGPAGYASMARCSRSVIACASGFDRRNPWPRAGCRE